MSVNPREHVGLAYKAATMAARVWGGDADEYVGEMYEHMVRAARYYDPTTGFRWSTYAMRCMLRNFWTEHKAESRRHIQTMDSLAIANYSARVEPDRGERIRTVLKHAVSSVSDDEQTAMVFMDVIEGRSWNKSMARKVYRMGHQQYYARRRLLRDVVQYLLSEGS